MHKRYLILLFLCIFTLPSFAKVRLFAGDVIEEKSTLLVKGTGLENLHACMWMELSEGARACQELVTRLNADLTRAKIYLPEVDEDMQARIVIRSGAYSADEQEFMVPIKNVDHPKQDSLKKFKFFTQNPHKKNSYSMSAARTSDSSFPLLKGGEFFLPGQRNSVTRNAYQAQKLSFKNNRKRRRKNKPRSKTRRPRFRDLFRLKPRKAPPEDPRLGDIFVSETHALCIFMDNTWLKIVGSGTCSAMPGEKPQEDEDLPEPKQIILE